jgi:hypothetical protein
VDFEINTALHLIFLYGIVRILRNKLILRISHGKFKKKNGVDFEINTALHLIFLYGIVRILRNKLILRISHGKFKKKTFEYNVTQSDLTFLKISGCQTLLFFSYEFFRMATSIFSVNFLSEKE